ncbi:hypothetical protein QE152_g16002 [Popillia japonica]|uniref:Mitochondrial fission regulator 1 n=1 Tax=Popillia japonica TaxID=7064 RepID=A0AAW1L459_POPJA
MGNVISLKAYHRHKISKTLTRLPSWIFGTTPRISINRNILEWKSNFEIYGSEADVEESWDSALDLSCDTESTASDQTYSPKLVRQRRLSRCCKRSVGKDELAALQEEIKVLRTQVAELLSLKESTQERPIPNPPPLPLILEDESSNVIYCSTPKSDRKEMLRDITNVKLKPIDKRETAKLPKPADIRYDLHEILKRRYAAMHSPCHKLSYSNVSEDENRIACQNDSSILAC